MIRIENKRTYKGEGFLVDRTTPVGNPFFMKDESQRDEVCDKYKEWFYSVLFYNNLNYEFINYLKKLLKHYKQFGEITLICWCAPKRCHAETIKEWLEKMR